MNRPKGLGVTAVLMALCNAMLWTAFNYANRPHPLEFLAFTSGMICIGFVFVWFYWMGKDWARITVLIFSGSIFYNLPRMWNMVSRPNFHATPSHIILVARALLSVALLYWLNTRPVVEFFKRNKVVPPPHFPA